MENCLFAKTTISFTKSTFGFYLRKPALLLIIFFSVISPVVLSQQIITGRVSTVDSALDGATVQVKGTNIATQTKTNGSFEINAPLNATLIISSVGYTSQEVKTGNRSSIDVQLQSVNQQMGEVVVVGYGSQKRANLTGAITSINSKKIAKISTANIVTGLAGQLPGLRVTQRNSEPGSFGTSFDIRGFGNPLIVIDGIVMDGSNFSRLNPNDIEGITVLKDASAAVYGIKAANGVILVTTKKGETGPPKITYSSYYEINKITNTPEVANAYSYALIATENDINGGNKPTFSPEDLQKFKDGTYPSTDWRGLVLRDYSTQINHNINVSGGSDRIKYFTSIGFLDEKGLWKSGDLYYKKYTVRSSVTGKISDNLQAELSLDGLLDQKTEPSQSTSNTFRSLYWIIPTIPVFANNNTQYPSDLPDGLHPLGNTFANYGGYTKNRNKTFQGTFSLNYKVPVIDGLSARFVFGYYNQDRLRKDWRKKFMMYTYDKPSNNYLNTNTKNSPSSLTADYFTFQRTTMLGQLNYDKVFWNKHSIKASAIFEERHELSDNVNAKKEFAVDLDQFFAGVSQNAQVNSSYAQNAQVNVNSSNIFENNNQNIIGRLNYDYSAKYLFEVGFNYSGSSRFPKGRRWGYFPFASAGWRISEEEFFRNKLPFVKNLKLRGSWGKMGDDGAASFQFLEGYNYPSGFSIFDDQSVRGLVSRGITNPNITWFTVTSKNIGVDLDLANGLINMQFDLFQRDRSGLLASRLLTIPGTVGANLPQENLNKDMRRGFELVLGHSKKAGIFLYDITGNFTYTRGQATYIERAPDANSYLNWRNNTTNRFSNIRWGFKQAGRFQTEEEIYLAPLQDNQGNKTVRVGDFKMEDTNKDGTINEQDMVPIGRGATPAIPEINFGLNGSFNYKSFDMNVLFQGAANYNYSYDEFLQRPLIFGRSAMMMFTDRWHHEDIYDVNSPWIPGRYPSTGYSPTIPGGAYNTTFWIPDASYIRLKSLEFGYTINKSLISRIGIKNCRFYVSGFNLVTWTKLQYVDPEKDGPYLYPITKNYNFGLNITL